MTTDAYYPDTFARWERRPAHTWPRRIARRAAIRLGYERLRLSGRLEEGLATPRIQFYCLHHLFRDEEAPFRALLTRLSEHFDFVTWSEGVRMVLEGEVPSRPVACFSSDDGYLSNLRLGRVLADFGASCCFFLNPVSLLPHADAWNTRFCATRLQARPTRFLSERDVESLLATGHEVGNHTLTHVVCSETPADQLAAEIGESRAWLESRFGPVPHFAWPYGQMHHFSTTAEQLVAETGHVSAAGVVRGAYRKEDSLPVSGDFRADPPSSLVTFGPGQTDLLILRRDQLWAAAPIEEALYFTARNGLERSGALPVLTDPVPPGTNGLAHWDAVAWPQASKAAQYAPSPRTAARNVRSSTARSSQMDQFRT
ncbi:MAG: polysaccharide deacetylase family protein [Rhodothermales bacterium]|nr:polysaccharide deacetylase family protein [Rhodothermales bacterium]